MTAEVKTAEDALSQETLCHISKCRVIYRNEFETATLKMLQSQRTCLVLGAVLAKPSRLFDILNSERKVILQGNLQMIKMHKKFFFWGENFLKSLSFLLTFGLKRMPFLHLLK